MITTVCYGFLPGQAKIPGRHGHRQPHSLAVQGPDDRLPPREAWPSPPQAG
jgi:hypothetical protein